MIPCEFLVEEFESVEQALGETLRYDYGSEQNRKKYYDECRARLDEIEKAIAGVATTDYSEIHAYLNQLSYLATLISLIERSHLGEFSWPFAEELRSKAETLLVEKDLKGEKLKPIVHVIADGQGYRIFNEPRVPAISGKHRFVIIAFPRPLKHHVLLHALFGHELGHAGLLTTGAGSVLNGDVIAALTSIGPMKDETAFNVWLNEDAAPQEIKDVIKDKEARLGQPYVFTNNARKKWLNELICDLFGLLLFGPGFLAAHRALLLPTHSNPYNFAETHPPYTVRHKMLVQAMRFLGWHAPITEPGHEEIYHAEKEFLNSFLEDQYDPWAGFFDDKQLVEAISWVQKIFIDCDTQGYEQIDVDGLVYLINRLKKGLPPIIAEIDIYGNPGLKKVEISQTLYAGWVYWVGRDHLKTATGESLDFFMTNRLCNQALLQQSAINLAIDGEGV